MSGSKASYVLDRDDGPSSTVLAVSVPSDLNVDVPRGVCLGVSGVYKDLEKVG